MKKYYTYCVFLTLFTWLALSCVAFRMRHPSARPNEFATYWWEVITFQEVGFLNMRPNP